MAGYSDIERSGHATILAVDDRPANLAALGRRLRESGYDVVLIDGGRAALERIARGGIDLVLLDMVMPGLSGVDVLAEIRADPETRDLPVIMVTARAEPQAAVEALAAGADDWIAKPFAFESLIARIARALARSVARPTLTPTADRARLVASIQALHDQVARLTL
ncbi:response regulator [Sphingomonas donggukensis]|uniref:Response regulator n=1 Tax=Sphingomonas donggukensis TaxID=2949093 RepID=A0ABY4TZ34_9SPHN|nr:response regulator [Sphingomonas donggukensis]URW75568.1 response regulator [Sphingomonas donggukensis]